MKKFCKWMLIVFAVLSVLAMAACGNNDDPSTTTDSTDTTNENTAVRTLDDIKTAGKLVMLTNAAFAPFEYLGEDGVIAGVDVEIAQAIADEIGVELEVVDMDFDGIIDAVKSGKGDLGVAGITADEERAQKVDFSINYIDTGLFIIVKEDNTEITTSEDLNGKTIGVQLGTTSDIICTGMEDDGEVMVARYKTTPDAVAELSNGRIDAVICDEMPAREAVSNTPGLIVIEEPLTTEQYAIAMAKGNTSLQEVVNNVLNRMLEDGTIDALIAKHMVAEEPTAE